MASPIQRVCEWCGKSFATPAWRVRQGKGRFCGKACRSRFVRKFSPGLNEWITANSRAIAAGDRFNGLVAVAPAENGKSGQRQWLFRCDCGRERVMSLDNVFADTTKACGCRMVQAKHGQHKTREYQTWSQMNHRCRNPSVRNWHRYGGRGIQVCAGWAGSAESFLADMGPRPTGCTIDRIDNDGHYSCGHCPECVAKGWPANCRWATRRTQSNNRENSRYLEWQGRKWTVAQWARHLGMNEPTIRGRLRRGASVDEALGSPVRPQRHHA